MNDYIDRLDRDELRWNLKDQDDLLKSYEDKIKLLTEENDRLKEELFNLNCSISEGRFK